MILGRQCTAEEIAAYEAAEKAKFDALPLIEQIRIVVRQEVRQALDEAVRWQTMDSNDRYFAKLNGRNWQTSDMPVYRYEDATDRVMKE
jgi:hypothetical protein